jgi:hypothetical protein
MHWRWFLASGHILSPSRQVAIPIVADANGYFIEIECPTEALTLEIPFLVS